MNIYEETYNNQRTRILSLRLCMYTFTCNTRRILLTFSVTIVAIVTEAAHVGHVHVNNK